MKDHVKRNFSYDLTDEQIKRYKKMPIEKRLEWLYLGNLLRKAFSEKMFDVQTENTG
jgi:hypothetical protein